jgi:hypothetical protein
MEASGPVQGRVHGGLLFARGASERSSLEASGHSPGVRSIASNARTATRARGCVFLLQTAESDL